MDGKIGRLSVRSTPKIPHFEKLLRWRVVRIDKRIGLARSCRRRAFPLPPLAIVPDSTRSPSMKKPAVVEPSSLPQDAGEAPEEHGETQDAGAETESVGASGSRAPNASPESGSQAPNASEETWTMD
jgi:hypothetical protein